MKLDSRIIDGKKPLDCFDTEQAKQFLGKECYFSDHLCTFNELLNAYSYVTADMLVSKEKHLYVGELLTVGDSDGSCYEAGINGEAEWFQFCLPCEWVKESEKKHRPYTMNEFKAEFKIGMVLTLRNRDTPDYVCQVMYLGNRQYDESDSDNNTIFLSQRFFSLRELFNMFEIVRNGEWQPFGIEE